MRSSPYEPPKQVSETELDDLSVGLRFAWIVFWLTCANVVIVPLVLLFGVAALGGGHGTVTPFMFGLAYLALSWVTGLAGLVSGAIVTFGDTKPIWLYVQGFFLVLPIIGYFAIDYLPI